MLCCGRLEPHTGGGGWMEQFTQAVHTKINIVSLRPDRSARYLQQQRSPVEKKPAPQFSQDRLVPLAGPLGGGRGSQSGARALLTTLLINNKHCTKISMHHKIGGAAGRSPRRLRRHAASLVYDEAPRTGETCVRHVPRRLFRNATVALHITTANDHAAAHRATLARLDMPTIEPPDAELGAHSYAYPYPYRPSSRR